MLAGHIGVAVGLQRLDARLNLGLLVMAAMLLDALLWLFVLAGLEQVVIPHDYTSRHYLTFSFPYSHGLLGASCWSILAAFTVGALAAGPPTARRRAGVVVGVAVFSHIVLDAIVHLPELPLAGACSPKIGLGLWERMPIALGVEALITVAGVAVWWHASTGSLRRKLWVVVYVALILGVTVVGQTVAPAPPGAAQVAGSSMAAILVMVAVGYGLDRRAGRRGNV